jgi:nitrous oxide reductase
VLDDPKQYYSVYSAVDGDTMKVAWQIRVDGNLDNTDADYQGKYAFSTCYNSEGATNLAGMMANEQDWVVIFNLKRIEEAVRRKDYREIGGVPVLDGTHGSALTRYVPVANSPHGINTAPWSTGHWQARAMAASSSTLPGVSPICSTRGAATARDCIAPYRSWHRMPRWPMSSRPRSP